LPRLRHPRAHAAVVTGATKPASSYSARRRGFHTKIRETPTHRAPAITPPTAIDEKVKYAAPLGDDTAYITPPSISPTPISRPLSLLDDPVTTNRAAYRRLL
jgi:hypothetical protein